jgi:phosphoenolpyruvate carboxykinase (GTP)
MKTKHKELLAWIAEIEAMCEPDQVQWANGSDAEYSQLMDLMVKSGMATQLNPKKRPNSYLFRSDPSDVARVENRTYIASEQRRGCRPDQQLDRSG